MPRHTLYRFLAYRLYLSPDFLEVPQKYRYWIYWWMVNNPRWYISSPSQQIHCWNNCRVKYLSKVCKFKHFRLELSRIETGSEHSRRLIDSRRVKRLLMIEEVTSYKVSKTHRHFYTRYLGEGVRKTGFWSRWCEVSWFKSF